jgi:hypothetical protein
VAACARYLPKETNVNLGNLPRLPIWPSNIKYIFLGANLPSLSLASLPPRGVSQRHPR